MWRQQWNKFVCWNKHHHIPILRDDMIEEIPYREVQGKNVTFQCIGRSLSKEHRIKLSEVRKNWWKKHKKLIEM